MIMIWDRSLMKVLKEIPITLGVVLVAIVLTLVSLIFKNSVYYDYVGSVENYKTPVLSLAFKGAMDGVFPWSDVSSAGDELVSDNDPADEMADQNLVTGDTDSSQPDEQASAEAALDGEGAANVGDISGEAIDGSLSESSDQGLAADEPVVYEFTEVDADYFNDALFIGDSRTVGLSEYCEELDTRATFYSKISLTIFDVFKKEFIKTEDGKIGVEQALSENQFGKIYIMLGLNEIGTGDAEYFKNAYGEVIDKIRELQPEAIIYIQGIMHVTAHKSDNDKYFTNDRVNERNAAISELADQQTVFYLDMNEAVDDENGNLDSELSFDDIHLKAFAYERWYQFLLHNAIVK